MRRCIIILICILLLSASKKKAMADEITNTGSLYRQFSYGLSIDKDFIYLNNEKFIVKGISYNPYYPLERNGDDMRKAKFEDDLEKIKEANINSILLYWRRPLRIYYACRELGLKIIQGIPIHHKTGDFQDERLKKMIKSRIRTIVDYVNKNNLSDAILAYFIGGEIDPYSIRTSDFKNKGLENFKGRYFSSERELNSIENFLMEMADYLRDYELTTYSNTHMISHINWPSSDEVLNIDFMDIAFFDIYSYWPEDVSEFQPGGSFTGTSYQGYLEELKEKYTGCPLIVSEFGYPTAPEDDLASVDEKTQGREIVNRWIDILTSKNPIAGGSIFEWNDEWWKQGKGAQFVEFEKDPGAHEKDDYEEWFGIISIDGTSYTNYKVRPKPAYDSVKMMYHSDFDPVKYFKEIRTNKGGDGTTLVTNKVKTADIKRDKY
ncbi:MAG: hypothetical protein KKH98_06965 [Spirochaetes bacterium]|nr:hypothetical protein [Spirochaetota bacterium]